MTKLNFIAIALIASTSLTVQVQAQENARPDQKIKTKSNINNDRVSVMKINGTTKGCSIVFGDNVVSPKDAASGLPTGKRMHKPFVITKEVDISSSDNGLTEITSPRDAATGQASGKVPMSDLSVMIKMDRKFMPVPEENGEYMIPTHCPNGDCEMLVSWSWGATNNSSVKRCETAFTLTMKDGVCMAINEKGHGGTNK